MTEKAKSTTENQTGMTDRKSGTTLDKKGTTGKKKSTTAPVWSIKGIERETRTAVRKAAKKEGTTIGAYVNRVLLEASTTRLKRKEPEPSPPAIITDMQTQLNQMREMIQQVNQKLDQPKTTIWSRVFGKK